jgi:hypothetical protein
VIKEASNSNFPILAAACGFAIAESSREREAASGKFGRNYSPTPKALVMTTSPRNRGWLWYILIVAGLAVIAVTILIVFNLRQQLTLEDVRAARHLWQQKGPRSYRLVYTVNESDRPREGDYLAIQVRDGKTISATRNGKEEPPAQLDRYGMESLFDLMEENLRQDAQSRVFTRGKFDAADGHVLWYVRSPRGKSRLEISVEALEAEPRKQPS